MHPGPCVGCGCTAEKACVVVGVPCHWADEHEPLCSACADHRLPVGTKVMVALGPRTGRRGAVQRAPKLFQAWRYVDLEATARAAARRQLFHLKDLVEVAS